MYKLPDLPYDYSALEPYIDSQTMEIHYTKHHQAYIDKLNVVIEKNPDLEYSDNIQKLLSNTDTIPEEIRKTVIDNGGGYLNHWIFWEIMGPNAGGEPEGNLAVAVKKTFGNFEEFKSEFKQTAITRFGSGWAWLVLANDCLEIISTPNQDNPISQGKEPLLGLDVWEHAYYLKYQNRRPDYIDAWWNVVNWKGIGEHYDGLLAKS